MFKVISTVKAPAAIGPYSQAIVAGDFLFASGQIPINPANGAIEAEGIEAQTEQVMKNIGAILAEAGTDYTHVVKTTCFLDDMGDFAAAKAVNAHDFILKLEKGYDTVLSERGGGLSIGQKQLLAFARTMVSDPRILILDEATSSIDTNTEILVQEGIEQLLKGRTSFVIAHRLSTIQKADRIFVIDDGRIIEEGNAAQLLAQKGFYYDLYMSQFKNVM